MATRARTKAAQHPYVWTSLNGSAAYADIDSGVAVAVMRNRFTVGDLSAAGRIDGVVLEAPS